MIYTYCVFILLFALFLSLLFREKPTLLKILLIMCLVAVCLATLIFIKAAPKRFLKINIKQLRKQTATILGTDEETATFLYRLIISENRLSLESFSFQNVRYILKKDIVYYQIFENSIFCFDDKDRGVLIPLGCLPSEEKEKITEWFDTIVCRRLKNNK